MSYRISLTLLALVLLLCASGVFARTVTDSAGRNVAVPEQVKRVFAAGPPAMVILYMLKPEALVGWPRAPYADELAYIAEPYRQLPEIGRLTGRGGEANLEVLLNARPDLIVDFGSVRDTYISLADRVQEQTGIPYVLIDGRFDNTAAALRLLGDILGVPARGEALARYVEQVFSDLDHTLEAVPELQRPRVYLARGPDGLETGVLGSINTEIIERAGGRNVVVAEGGRRGLTEFSMEQVLKVNPDTIITWDENFYRKVFDDALWLEVDAVKQGRVYLSPTAPFGWIDRPPSVNRIIGLKWLSAQFYPSRVQINLSSMTREFYRLFYHVELDEDALQKLMQWTPGKPPR